MPRWEALFPKQKIDAKWSAYSCKLANGPVYKIQNFKETTSQNGKLNSELMTNIWLVDGGFYHSFNQEKVLDGFEYK